MNVAEQLRAIISDYTGNDYLDVEGDTLLTTGLGLDSYDLASLLGAVEERFNIVIPDRAVMGMLTVGDVVDYLEKHIEG